MSALFTPRSDATFRLVLVILAAGAVGTIAGLMVYWRTPYGTAQFHEIAQPVQFDHRHHVQDDLIDCRYCHSSVDKAPSAGIPSTELCLNCHAQVWNKSPLLDVVRASWFADQPIQWTRVHRLPDFVYFNHSIHVNKGVGCVECHGRVDQMAAIQQVMPMNMGWCLDCHRNPEPRLRPVEEVTNMRWKPEGDPVALGKELAKKYDVQPRTDCYTCHR
ncbi:MAG TPA: cytochrome c3 family protein [Anaeromyxobacteraceae bacterium]|nr:cytochrome c3 family protein [Anaeromyxobacteraceae bacterium]